MKSGLIPALGSLEQEKGDFQGHTMLSSDTRFKKVK
jgi:hypothetical protein